MKKVTAKNIVVFPDDTGQEGGLRAEQRLSNIYKLYRVCRVGPDSGIEPRDQVAFCQASARPPYRSVGAHA